MDASPSEPVSTTSPERVSFVCCIESGVLETMAVRLVESLRRFGGRFATSRVTAVTSRFGPPISRVTRRRLLDLDVNYVRVPLGSRFSWLHYINREVALLHAEGLADTELIGYLDADMLVLGEPEAFDLPPGVDFAALPSDVTVGATTGPSDPTDVTWRSICQLTGISIDDLPWVKTVLDGQRVRLYFQGGVFIYRREIALGRKLHDLLITVLEKRVRLPGNAWTFVDQTLPGPLLVRDGYSWAELPFSHNYTMASYLPQYYDPDSFRLARLVHYHDSMSPHFWPTLLARLAAEQPHVAEWLEPLGPVVDRTYVPWKALSEVLRLERGMRRRLYYR